MADDSQVHDDPRPAVAALERGLAALTERVERLEAEVLPRELRYGSEVVDRAVEAFCGQSNENQPIDVCMVAALKAATP